MFCFLEIWRGFYMDNESYKAVPLESRMIKKNKDCKIGRTWDLESSLFFTSHSSVCPTKQPAQASKDIRGWIKRCTPVSQRTRNHKHKNLNNSGQGVMRPLCHPGDGGIDSVPFFPYTAWNDAGMHNQFATSPSCTKGTNTDQEVIVVPH